VGPKTSLDARTLTVARLPGLVGLSEPESSAEILGGLASAILGVVAMRIVPCSRDGALFDPEDLDPLPLPPCLRHLSPLLHL